jgi:flagellar motor switch/type III secretory pathway protein FliN
MKDVNAYGVTAMAGQIPLTLMAALECPRMPLEQAANLEPGALIRSRQAAGDNVLIYAGGELIGHGEIVVFEGSMGVRITSLEEVA